MAVSIAEMIVLGLMADWLCRQVRMPGLIGMLAVGVLFGPYVLGLLDPDLLAIGPDLRLIALIVILLRAGFELSRRTLRRVGKRVLLLSFVPAVIEGVAIALAAPRFFGLSPLEGAILGSVLAAVSPAVVVPMMIRFMRQRKGAAHGVPTMVLAAASLDDVFVIVVYSLLMGIYLGQKVQMFRQLLGIPLSILLGILVGLVMGRLLVRLFERFNPRATKRVLIVIACAILLIRVEKLLESWVPFAALVATMSIGFFILEHREGMAHEIAAKLAKIWVFAEIMLFAMVGAQVNLDVVWQAGLAGAAVIAIGIVARSLGTWLCLVRSPLTPGERFFVVVAYTPKATVQAAIGSAPLVAMRAAGMETGPGEIILAVAVLSIVLTAPAGAWAIAALGDRVLRVESETASSDPVQESRHMIDCRHENDS